MSAFTSGRYAPASYCCPRCHGVVDRIRRRLVDRLISNFVMVYRYRCHSLVCGWEGNLRAKPSLPRPGEGKGRRAGADRSDARH